MIPIMLYKVAQRKFNLILLITTLERSKAIIISNRLPFTRTTPAKFVH